MSDPFSSQLLRMAKDEGYALGVQHSMQRLAQSERILTDLIAELREHVDLLDGLGYQNLWDAQRDARDITDRAEARLREATGDE